MTRAPGRPVTDARLTQREIARRWREKKLSSGLVEIKIWLGPEEIERLRAFAAAKCMTQSQMVSALLHAAELDAADKNR